jgi:hypothetical protein
MIALFAKRGWFWELMFWLLVLELARAIGSQLAHTPVLAWISSQFFSGASTRVCGR